MANLAQLKAQYDEAVAAGDIEKANSIADEASSLKAREANRPVASNAEPVEQPQAPAQMSIAQQAAAAGYPIAYPYGISTPPTQEQARDISIGAVRYGAPIVAGIATGGVGLVPAAVMAGTAMASEGVAQFLERAIGQRDEMEPRKLAAAGAFAASPIFRFAQPIAGVSPGVVNFLSSTVSSGVAGEAGRAIEAGEMFPESKGTFDAAMRFTTPFISGLTSRFGSNVEVSQARAKQISEARGGGGLFNPDGTFANVLLSEANPALLGMEQRSIKNFNPSAVDRMIRTDDNMAKVAMDLVQEAPDATPIARELMQNMQLSGLKDRYTAAKNAADQAQEAARVARQSASADAQRLMAQAEDALREKMRAKAAFDQGLSRVTGPKLPNLFAIDPATVASEIKQVANDSIEAIKMARSGLYDATGIQINDPVVGLDEVLARASEAAKRGGLLAGEEMNSKFSNAIQAAFGEKTQLSREQFVNFKNEYAKRLAGSSTDPKSLSLAEKQASDQYNILKSAANDYIGRKYGPEIQKQWNAANEAYAQSVASLDSDVVKLLANDKFGEFFKQVKDGGKNSPAWKQLNQYADFLSGVSQKAIASGAVNPADLAVADNFRQHIYAGLLKGMFEESLVDNARKASKIAGADAIDPKKFVQNIAELETKGEFPVKEVFGANANDFRRLARFIDQKFSGRINQSELTDWLSMLPKDGVDVATKRLIYRKQVRDALMDTNIERRNAALRKAENEAGILRKDANALFAEYDAASKDPLTRFFADTNFKIDPNDYVNNSKLASRIVQEVDPVVMNEFVKASKASGKQQLVEDLGKIAAADAVRRFLPTVYEGVDKLRLRDITDFFYSADDKIRKQRENLIALIGRDRYNVIKKDVVDPISAILRGREAVQPKAGGMFDDVRAIATIYGGAQGNITGGAMAAQGSRNILKAADNKMYNVLSQVYLNPKFGPALASVGYDLTKFAQLSPVYSAQVNLSLAKDAEANQAELQRQYLTQSQPTR